MKLRELSKREATITVKDEKGNEVSVLLTSMTMQDIEERNEYYEQARKKAIEYAHDNAPHVFKEIDAMTDDQLRSNLLGCESMRLETEVALMDIENQDALTAEQVEKKRDVEKKKLVKELKKKLDSEPRKDLSLKAQIYYLRNLQSLKFSELMDVPSLVIIAKDPETRERILSMDPNSEDYVGHVDGLVLQELLNASFTFRDQIDAWGLIKLNEDPNFLLSSPLVPSGE